MKVLILYPNLPLMMSPSISAAIFTDICDKLDVDVRLFETTVYIEDSRNSQDEKEDFGAGRKVVDYSDAFENIYPTNQMIPDLVKCVEEYQPDLLFLTCVEDTFADGIEMLKALKPYNIPHIMGGVFPINAPWIALENEHVDIIAIYEGEYVVRDALMAMKEGRHLTDIDGIWYKEDGKVVQKNRQPLCDINEYSPNYRLFEDNMKRFVRPVGGRARVTMPLETYRGCPYSCTYCNSPTTRAMDRNFLRRKTIDTVKKELEEFREKYDPGFLFIIDDSFTARPKRELFALCELLGDFGIPWWCNTRLDDISPEILDAMKAGGCERIQFGLESGNEKYRSEVLLRKVKQEVYHQKAKILNDSGIPYGLNVILGMPDETRSMVMDTARLCKEIGGYDGLGVSIFVPYHGTGLREIAVNKGYMPYDMIGSEFGLQGLPTLTMPEPYLQKEEIMDLAQKFKYYAYFDEKYWADIDAATDLTKWEKIYNEEFFYSPLASPGYERVEKRKRSPWACAADEYMAF